MPQSRLVRLGVAAFALASTVVAPAVASAEPVCRLEIGERTTAGVTHPAPKAVC